MQAGFTKFTNKLTRHISVLSFSIMAKYYKLISLWPAGFGGRCKVSDWDELLPGHLFTCPGRDYKWCISEDLEPGVGILSEIPVFHFCDNALDTVLWHKYLSTRTPEFFTAPYEIRPRTKVYKERSRDDVGLYQCGSYAIEIVRPITMGKLERRAIAEFESDPSAAIFRYPNINILYHILEMKKMNNMK